MKNVNVITLIGVVLVVGGCIFGTVRGIMRIYVGYEYKNTVKSYWDLSERASTIKQKSEYMDKFVNAIEPQKLHGINGALWMQTPETDFDQNFKALTSLQSRLHDVDTMDIQSFAYQTAIQQITEQEQGEGGEMLDAIYDCWEKQNYYSYWNPLILWIFVIIQFLCIGGGIIICISQSE